MTDERREAATSWLKESSHKIMTEHKGYITPTLIDAHLAGQECGEQRAAQEIAKLMVEVDCARADAEMSVLHETERLHGVIERQEAEIAKLREAIGDFLCECVLVEDFHRNYEVWQITKGSTDELRKLLEEKP